MLQESFSENEVIAGTKALSDAPSRAKTGVHEAVLEVEVVVEEVEEEVELDEDEDEVVVGRLVPVGIYVFIKQEQAELALEIVLPVH